MIRELGAWIETKTAGWTRPWIVGENLLTGYIPVDVQGGLVPERCAILLERTPGAVIPDLPDRVDLPIQILNRAKDYIDAHNDAWQLFRLLHVNTWFDLPATFGLTWEVLILDAMGSPFCIANPNEKGLFEFSTNYMFRLRIPQSGDII